MSIRTRLAGILGALLVTASATHAAQAEPLRIFYFTWVGYGPLFVAQEKGYFAKEGIEVSLINNNDPIAAYAGLAAGQVDAVAGGLQDVVLFAEPDADPMLCVLVNDDTRGADGIVANLDIQSIDDLKGKTVALQVGGTPQFFLNALLREVGLSEADLAEVLDLDADEAAEALLLQEVDAAVTYEPWLSQAKNADHVHLLTDSSAHPGLIVDCVTTTQEILRARRAEFQALGRAWDGAVDFLAAHPNEAHEIIARKLGGSLEDPAVVADSIRSGIHFYDGEENRAFFGTPDHPGQINETVQRIIDVWSDLGRMKADISPPDVIAHDVWE
jgi:NitT/TauT family transport system substrate-binding protein